MSAQPDLTGQIHNPSDRLRELLACRIAYRTVPHKGRGIGWDFRPHGVVSFDVVTAGMGLCQ